MVQIISDRQSNWVDWLGSVINRLENYPTVSKMVVFAETEENDDNAYAKIVEFMNCDTDDIYNVGSILQKESIKHELAEEFGLNDSWEEDNYDDI